MSDFIEAFSRLLNVVLLCGEVNESISARCYRLRSVKARWMIGYKIINVVFFWQNNHCRGAYRNRTRQMKEWLSKRESI